MLRILVEHVPRVLKLVMLLFAMASGVAWYRGSTQTDSTQKELGSVMRNPKFIPDVFLLGPKCCKNIYIYIYDPSAAGLNSKLAA